MIIEFNKLILLGVLSLIIYFLNIKFYQFNHSTKFIHQKFSIDILGNPIGGYTVILFIILFKFYFSYLELLFLFLIFFSGILSDIKLFNSPSKRLFFQILVISLSVYFSNIEIISTKIILFDYLLTNKIINLGFTTFCILIVINGTNFIDGLNGLVTGYYLIVVITLLRLDLNIDYYFQSNLLINFSIILIILLFVNFLNKVFLGDNGSYLLGFIFSIFLIRVHQINTNVSPYFVILLLWYPCFENLFSIIRKRMLKVLATSPDNNHLHQLLFFLILKKLKTKKKLLANNLTSIVINIYNLCIFFISLAKYDNSSTQLMLILTNIIIYICAYIYLYKYKKNFNYSN
jgi:UDP-N-acetylmuramyl pentapeptide phosphotransferase/UDP-N-acetylglucosamine-1-phosphate transferase